MKEVSQYFKQDRREWDVHGSLIFPPITDPTGLSKLLQQRHSASLSENSSVSSNHTYEQVARIDQRLKDEFNIVVYSHPPIWSRFDSNAPPDAIRKQQIQKELQTLQRAFGPMGHPYRHFVTRNTDYSFLYCDLSMTDIHDLLSQYTKYKYTFQPELADATLFELKLHGVRVSDQTFQWTTDPFCDIDSEPKQTSSMERDIVLTAPSTTDLFNRIRQNRNHTAIGQPPYLKDPVATDGVDERNVERKTLLYKTHQQLQQVEQLIRDRFMAMQREEYDLVSWITYELYCTYNVTVNDSTKQWTIGSRTDTKPQPHLSALPNPKPMPIPSVLFGNEGYLYDSAIRYRESRHSRFPPDLPEPQRSRITSLVQERIQKREEGKFQEADTIRTVLWHSYNVGISDRLQEYSFGGLFGDE